MRPPSKSWLKVRHATLERACDAAIKPLKPLYGVHLGACAIYLIGFAYLFSSDIPPEPTTITLTMLLVVAASGVLVPILTASVLTLHFANQKLRKLLNDYGNSPQIK